MVESLTAHINGDENPADLLTKVICSGKRRYVVNNNLHDVYNGEFKLYTVAELTSNPRPSTSAGDT